MIPKTRVLAAKTNTRERKKNKKICHSTQVVEES
jgi:hypothetical protein